MVDISFSHPHYLFFLFLIPVFILIHFVTLRSIRTSALRFANFDLIARVKGVDFFSRSIVILFLSGVIVLFLAMAVSGATLHTVIDASSHSFVVSLDSSRSMEANDILPNRMEAAKEAAMSFVDATPLATRIGVISFSGNSFIEQDLTNSKILVKAAIRKIAISGIGGTDLYEAVITGTNMLKNEESKAIVILSDGQNNVGFLDEAINYANTNDVVVHTIAFGTEEGGLTDYGLSKVDEDSLKALAFNTDGEFFRATNKEELLESFNNAITLTKKKVAIDLTQYLVVAAMLLFALEYLLINTRYRRLP